jgi:hypothetical protein
LNNVVGRGGGDAKVCAVINGDTPSANTAGACNILPVHAAREGMSMARAVSGTRQARSIFHASASLHRRAKAQDFKARNPSQRHLQRITATFATHHGNVSDIHD